MPSRSAHGRRAPWAASLVLVLGSLSAAQVTPTTTGRATERGDALGRPPEAPVVDPLPATTTAASIQLTGSVRGARDVEIQGPLGTLLVPAGGGAFAAQVPLAADAVNQLFVTGIASTGVRGAAALVRVTRDLMAPELLVESPLDGALVPAATVDVAGTVGDALSGYQGLTVSVNGVAADVDVGFGTNGTFLATDVPLTLGAPTVLTTVATDALGNQSVQSVQVTRVEPPAGSAVLGTLSGDGQTGQTRTELPQPIVVQVLRGDRTPFAGKLVTFAVTRSDGMLATTSNGTPQRVLQVFADANGEARAWWTLGSDAGCGNNRVQATAVDVFGAAELCASATPQAAARVLVSTGNAQVGEAGAPALLPLSAWVTDGCNGLAGVGVTFQVAEGDGSFGGQSSVVVASDATGIAAAPFTLGSTPGTNRVEADFAGNAELPASFLLEGLARQGGGTTFVGLVLDDGGAPLENATVHMAVGAIAPPSVFTDAAGTFSIDLTGASGPGHLSVDASTVTHRAGVPVPLGSFPHLGYQVNVVPDAVNRLPEPIRLPELKAENRVLFDNQDDVVLTIDGIAGLAFRVQAGSMTLADGSVPGPGNPVLLSVDTVQVTDIPMPLPNGAAFPIAWTLQPSGALFDPPVAVTLPNAAGLPAGAAAYVLSFDHDVEAFSIVANARVSDDGTVVESVPGDGIAEAGWGGVCPPYPPLTTVAGQVNRACDQTTGFFGSVIALFDYLDNPCGQIPDPILRRVCVQNGVACLQNVLSLGTALSGTLSNGMPQNELRLLADDALQEYLEYQAALNGSQVPPFASQLLTGTEYRVSQDVPGLLVDATLQVDFGFAPDLALGDVYDTTVLVPYAAGPGLATFEVTAFPFATRAEVRVRVAALDFRPRATVFAGGRSMPLPPSGSFVLRNVPAMAQIPLRPLIVYEGVDRQRLVGPSVFQLPTISGTTDFGMLALDPAPLRRRDLTATPAVATFDALGAAQSLSVTATLEDGSLLFAPANADGSGYTVSDPGVVAVDAFGNLTSQAPGTSYVTVSNEGTAETVSVVVAPGDPLTTVTGIVTLADGLTPVAGASVRIFPGDLGTTTAADGSFVVPAVPTVLGPLTARVRADLGTEATPGVASVSGVTAVPGAFTDLGTVPLVTPVFWNVNANGNWEDGASWSTGSPPAAGDVVLIDRPSGSYTVTLNGNADLTALFCEEGLRVRGTLAIADPTQVNGLLTLEACTLQDVELLPTLVGSARTAAGDSAFDGVTLGMAVVVGNESRIGVTNGLHLTGGSFSLQASTAGAAFAELVFSGAQSLSGTGEVEFTSSLVSNRLIVAGGPLTIASGVPLRGNAGEIGGTGETIVLRSEIVAEGSLLRVLSDLQIEGARLAADPGAFVEVLGSIDAGGESVPVTGELRFNGLTDATVDGDATTLLRAGSAASLDGVTLSGGELLVPSGIELVARNGLSLAGTLVTLSGNAPNGILSRILFDGPQTLGGTGEVFFSTTSINNGLAVVNGPLTVEAGVAIRGLRGSVGSTGEAIVLRGPVTAEQVEIELRGTVTAEGIALSAVPGARIELLGPVDATGQTLTLSGEIRFEDAIVGGTLQGDATAVLRPSSASTVLDGVALSGGELRVPSGIELVARNGLTLNGTLVTLSGNAPNGILSSILFDGPQTLGGTGEVLFATNSLNNGLAVVNGPLTVEAGVAIRGVRGNVGSTGEAIVLRGPVTAEQFEIELRGTVTAEGIALSAVPGANIELVGPVDTVGQTLALSGEIRFGSAIVGGTLQGDASSELRAVGTGAALDGVTLAVPTTLTSGTRVTVTGDLVLANARVTFLGSSTASGNAILDFQGAQTLSGPGELFLASSSANNRVDTGSGQLTIASDVLARGARGRIGSGGGSVLLQGSLVPDAGGRIDLGGAFVNDGLVVIGGVGTTVQADASGSYAQTSNGRLEVELAGTNPGTGYDRLVIAGSASLGGELVVTVLAPFTPAVGQTFRPLGFASASGAFDDAVAIGVPAGLGLLLKPLATAIELEVVNAEGAREGLMR